MWLIYRMVKISLKIFWNFACLCWQECLPLQQICKTKNHNDFGVEKNVDLIGTSFKLFLANSFFLFYTFQFSVYQSFLHTLQFIRFCLKKFQF